MGGIGKTTICQICFAIIVFQKGLCPIIIQKQNLQNRLQQNLRSVLFKMLIFYQFFLPCLGYRLVNLSPELITASVIGSLSEFTIQPSSFFDIPNEPAIVSWKSKSYNGTRNITSAQLPLIALNSVPMVAAEGGVTIGNITYRRISQGTNLVIDGKLLRVTSVYQSTNDLGYVQLHWQESTDNGLTFSKFNQSTRLYIKGIQDETHRRQTRIPSLVYLKDGRMLLGCLVQTSGQQNAYYVCISYDKGKTFNVTNKISLFDNVFYDASHDRMIVLSSGRIIVPVSIQSCDGCMGYCQVYYSDDGGNTFKLGSNVDFGASTCEQPAVQPIDDNTLLMLARSRTGHAMAAISPNQGVSWSKAVITNFSAPFASVQLKRINNQLYAFYNKGSVRKNLTMARMVSPANFSQFVQILTFTGDVVAAKYPSHQYPTAIVTPDGNRLFLSYWGTSNPNQDDAYQLLDLKAISFSQQLQN